MALVRYARVSTAQQNLALQLDALRVAGCEPVFDDHPSGAKRAAFVRYWGEGHVPQSPANIRDLWQRIFAWFAAHAPR